MIRHLDILPDTLSRLWSQILGNFVVPEVPKIPTKDRKVVVVGLTTLLTRSSVMVQDNLANIW